MHEIPREPRYGQPRFATTNAEAARPLTREMIEGTRHGQRLTCSQVHPQQDIYHPEGHPPAPIQSAIPTSDVREGV